MEDERKHINPINFFNSFFRAGIIVGLLGSALVFPVPLLISLFYKDLYLPRPLHSLLFAGGLPIMLIGTVLMIIGVCRYARERDRNKLR